MNKQNTKLALFFIIGLLTAFLVMYFINNYKVEKKNKDVNSSEVSINNDENTKVKDSAYSESTNFSGNIDECKIFYMRLGCF